MATPFPDSSVNRIVLPPLPDAAGVSSANVGAPNVTVTSDTPSPTEPYQPLWAIAFSGQPQRFSRVAACPPDWAVCWNDTFNHGSIWLVQILPGETGPNPAVPPNIELQVRVANACVNVAIFDGVVEPTSWSDSGMIASEAGILCQQIELWGRLPTVDDEPPPAPVKLRMRVALTKSGGGVFSVTYGDPLFVGGPALVNTVG